MSTTINLDPVTRLEGHMKVSVTLNSSNIVTDAKSTGNMFRGFEQILVNRPAKDASFITQRICGVCPVSHALASAKATESVLKFKPTLQGLLLRNLVQGADFIQSNILHFYHLSVMDYISGPQLSPWAPSLTQDLRFSSSDTQTLVNNYIAALTIRRKAHEMGAIFCGKLPHAANIVPGGITAKPTAEDISTFKSLLSEVEVFVNSQYKNDVYLLAKTYKDYYYIGKGYGNLICFGAFDNDNSGNMLFPSGIITGKSKAQLNLSKIREDVRYSWYSSVSAKPPSKGSTVPEANKPDAYSWLKSPRYNSLPYEAGPLARMSMSGDYKRGISVIDRHIARYIETAKIIKSMKDWIEQISVGVSGYTDIGDPISGAGYGLTEASRGALGHWLSVNNSKISRYQIITPTCWNASPKDDADKYGPIEKALIGTYVENPEAPVELLRIVHSFDPCLACAVHVISPDGQDMSKFIVNPI